MPAYMTALNRSVHDRQTLETYWQPARLLRGGARSFFPFMHRRATNVDGTEGVVLIEVPDVAEATAWYESPAYQRAKQHRDGAADIAFFIRSALLIQAPGAFSRLLHLRQQP